MLLPTYRLPIATKSFRTIAAEFWAVVRCLSGPLSDRLFTKTFDAVVVNWLCRRPGLLTVLSLYYISFSGKKYTVSCGRATRKRTRVSGSQVSCKTSNRRRNIYEKGLLFYVRSNNVSGRPISNDPGVRCGGENICGI